MTSDNLQRIGAMIGELTDRLATLRGLVAREATATTRRPPPAVSHNVPPRRPPTDTTAEAFEEEIRGLAARGIGRLIPPEEQSPAAEDRVDLLDRVGRLESVAEGVRNALRDHDSRIAALETARAE